ncbi:MAG TPA: flagellar basal body L-ring protein FlgH [Buchnera sp. (in: enterobacteria)]|nr:flagellar basal body L-ring protein FlgH [Buchnera sp. (in: enterobacteria)]
MFLKKKYYIVIILICFLTGCNNFSNTIFNKNKIIENRSVNLPIKKVNNSLLQEPVPMNHSYQPLFEDHKPRNIGDTMTIILQENLSASNKTSSNISRNSNSKMTIGIPNIVNSVIANNMNKTGLDGLAKNDFYGKGSSSSENSFLGVITVIVHSILPNGNLNVFGEKKIAINQGTECIRFSGIVDPHTISKDNAVISTQVANANIEYISNNDTSSANKMGWLQRFLFKILPI